MDSFQELSHGPVHMVTEEEGPQLEDLASFVQMRAYLQEAMKRNLVPYERDVLRLTYGIDDGTPRPRRAVSRMLEIRHKDVSVVCKRLGVEIAVSVGRLYRPVIV